MRLSRSVRLASLGSFVEASEGKRDYDYGFRLRAARRRRLKITVQPANQSSSSFYNI